MGVDWPEQERALRPPEGGGAAHPGAVAGREFVDFEGEYYRTHEATHLRPSRTAGPDLHRGFGPGRRPPRRADRRRASSAPAAKGAELYTETLLPALAEGAEKAGRDAAAMDRMIEMKVSFDTDLDRAMEDTKVWAALALTGRAEDGHPRPARDGGRGEGGRAVRAQALAGRPRTPTSTSSRSRPTSGTGSTTSCSTSRGPTRRPRSPATARWSCPGCGRASAHDGHRSLPDAHGLPTRSGAWPSRPAPGRTGSPSAVAPGRRSSAPSRSRSRSGTGPPGVPCGAARHDAHNDLYLAGSGGSWCFSATRASTSGCATWPPAPPSPRRRHSGSRSTHPSGGGFPLIVAGTGPAASSGLGPAAGAGPRPGRRGPEAFLDSRTSEAGPARTGVRRWPQRPRPAPRPPPRRRTQRCGPGQRRTRSRC